MAAGMSSRPMDKAAAARPSNVKSWRATVTARRPQTNSTLRPRLTRSVERRSSEPICPVERTWVLRRH